MAGCRSVNALAESFFAWLESELFDRSRYEAHREARLAVVDYIEAFHNRKRLHSSLGYLSPLQYEQEHDPQLALAC